MVLVLKPNAAQEAALEELLRAQQDPGSPYYHRWLTPEAFGQRFGISRNDAEEITKWLQMHGLETEELSPPHRTVVFSGTVAQVESTLHTHIQKYSVRGESHFANSTDPEIPEALSPVVQGVLSLHDFVSAPMGVITPAFTAGGAHYLMPQDWATIYDVTPLYSQGLTGSGQSIAVLGRVDILLSDVRTFRSNASLTANDPQIVVNGADPGGSGSGDQVESSLDVEWAGAIAKNAAVKFITSKSGASDGIALSAQYAVTHNVAPIVTLSYGLCEAWEGTGGNTFWNGLWQQAAAQGMSVFVSSGDSGAAGCDSSSSAKASNGRGVNGLCSSPYSTCVGGTEFVEGSNPGQYWSSTNGSGSSSALGYIPEATWNESGNSGLWASGGGESMVYSKPSWQSAIGVLIDGARDVPDISATAAMHDSYIVEIQGQMMAVGGTSAAAPSVASAMALAVQNAGSAQGNLNPIFYRLAARQFSSGGAAVFHDITNGNNSVPGVTGFNATAGYDATTGLGSIDANLLINHWNDGGPNFALNAGSTSLTIVRGSSSTVKLTLTPSNGFNSSVALSASGAPAGVTVGLSSATITTSSSVTITISTAASAVAGSSTITITGTGAGLKRTTQIALTVVVPTLTLTASSTSASVGLGKNTSITLTSAAQNLNSAVALSVSGLPKGVTAAFSPTSIASPGNGNSKLTLSASSSAAIGNSTVTVTATGGGLTKTQSLTLTVTH